MQDNPQTPTSNRAVDPATLPLVNEAEKQTNSSLLRPPTSGSWKPGQSGNPTGRPPKDWSWKDLLIEEAEEYIEYEAKDGTTVRQQFKKLIARKLIQLAAKGDMQAIKEIIDRMDGKARQSMDLQTQGGMSVIMCRYPHETEVTDLNET